MATLKPVLNNPSTGIETMPKVETPIQPIEQSNVVNSEYPYELHIGNNTYHFRKWKVKDLKQYRDLGKDTGVFDKKKARDILVNNIIQEDVFLDVTQYTYALLMINQVSTNEKMPYRFKCSNCNEEYDYFADFTKICTLEFKGYSKIETSSDVIELCELNDNSQQLKEFYELKLDDDNKDDFVLTDLICHVKTINGKTLKPSELIEYFDNLEMDDFTKVLNAYNDMKYTLDFTSEVECPHCKHKVQMLFDEMPDLIPKEFSNHFERELLNKLRR